jgi:hypothetical protein
MYSFRRFALLLALLLPAAPFLLAQDSSSSSASAPQAQQTAPAQNQGQVSVQARIRARREQRRAQAIHDSYDHLYEAFVGGGFMRFAPGPSLQRADMYSWDVALTRYFNQKLGVTVDGRGYYGTAYIGLNEASLTKPKISQYGALAGPTYRFYLRPRYSLAVRALGGVAIGNFGGDIRPFTPQSLGMYPDATTYAIDGGIVGEVNISPAVSIRLSGDYYGTGFGSTIENSFGATYGFVYRFGKQ